MNLPLDEVLTDTYNLKHVGPIDDVSCGNGTVATRETETLSTSSSFRSIRTTGSAWREKPSNIRFAEDISEVVAKVPSLDDMTPEEKRQAQMALT